MHIYAVGGEQENGCDSYRINCDKFNNWNATFRGKIQDALAIAL